MNLKNWKFILKDENEAFNKKYDDSNWEDVIVPHDWAIERPFSKEYSSGTGYVVGGIGWYRTSFEMDKDVEGKKVFITFDGVYKNSTVWCNGTILGKRPFGFGKFTYDITEYVRYNDENIISVKVEHNDISDCRWYTGSGIYRKVSVFAKEVTHIKNKDLFITTKENNVNISALISNEEEKDIDIKFDILYKDKVVKTINKKYDLNGNTQIEENIAIENINKWSVDTPNLYKLRMLYKDDVIIQTFGFRDFEFKKDSGFYLNGENMKLKGVCIHDDAGSLGVAVTKNIWQRRLEKLKNMGANAIRMSHNPHMNELYDMCDEIGFLVIDEVFDEWEGCKNKWHNGHNIYPPKHEGYSLDYPNWHKKDVEDFIKNNRNHPSIIMWSVGNEIDYPNDPYCHESFKEMVGNNDKNKPKEEMRYNKDKPNMERLAVLAKNLVELVKKYDVTRPVSLASAFPELSASLGLLDNLDIAGFNYKEHLYDEFNEKYKLPIMGSENNHAYELWQSVLDRDFISGQFLWTGIDYLGESRGIGARGSSAGLLNTAGYEKTAYYRRKALWSNKPFAYIATMYESEYLVKDDKVNLDFYRTASYSNEDKIIVRVYTNIDELELFDEDKSLGVNKNSKGYIQWECKLNNNLIVKDLKGNTLDRLDKVFEPIKINTNLLKSEDDIIQVEVSLVDKNNNISENTCNKIFVESDGLISIESGDLTDWTCYKETFRNTLNGRAIIYLRSNATYVNITSSGLLPVKINKI